MTIAIQSERGRVVPHIFLQGFDVISCPDAVHRKGMAQVVYPVMFKSGGFQDVLKFFPDGWLGIVAAIRMIEHKAGKFAFVPEIAHLLLLPLLINLVLF